MKLFLHSLAYELGELRPIDRAEGVDPDLLETFLALGLEQYAHGDADVIELARRSLLRTLEAAPIQPSEIDLFVLTSSERTRGLSADMVSLADELGLHSASTAGVYSWDCSNLFLALRTAAHALMLDEARHALVVTADRCHPGEPRLVPPGLSVLSDGAASAILSREPIGPCFEMRSLSHRANVRLSRVDPGAELGDYFKGVVAGLKETAKAALDSAGLTTSDVARVVINNYNRSIQKTFAGQMGFDLARVYLDNLSRFAHCNAADAFINLADLDRSGGLAQNGAALLIATGPTHWGGAVVVKR